MKTNLLSKEKNVAKFTMEFTAEEFEQACIDAYKATNTLNSSIKLFASI